MCACVQMTGILLAFPVPMVIDMHNDSMDVGGELKPMDVDDAGSNVNAFRQTLLVNARLLDHHGR